MMFILIQRTRGSLEEEWIIPDKDIFNDVVNEVICILTYRDSPAIKVYAWSDPKRGIIALEMFSKARIEELRGTIRDWGAKGGEKYEYETYLNDAIVER